jgi:hypothetical protein
MIDPAKFRCIHRHTGLEHPVCYARAQPKRIGYLDIEASNLDADFGFILSWCIKEADKNKYYGYVLTKQDYETTQRDRNAIKALIPTLAQFDVIVTYYGHDWQFDMPFIRARALKYGFQFIPYKGLIHLDLYRYAKSKFKLHSGRLDTAAEFFGLAEKTKIKSDHWRNATMKHSREALRYIWRHNKIDCLILEQLHKILEPYIPQTKRSI